MCQLFFRKFEKIEDSIIGAFNFCWVANFFAISVVPTRNVSLWSFEVLHNPPQGFSAHTYVLNSIELECVSVHCHLKDREIFEYSINIFDNSKSDIAELINDQMRSRQSSVLRILIVLRFCYHELRASDVDACETVVVRRFITFFLVATFLFLGLSSDILNIMDVSVSFSVVSHKLTWILISDGYLSKEAYRGCAVELMGPFVFPGFGR
ncbi:hypothetical protein V1477_009255 [Vespula maculifrons]|uniref:Uncharacterized protein n=1 Tax=Vespula maculifrons TaxID=7453 RepID=A0ABD2C994_VESMC